MYCPKCGRELPAGSQFCPGCGNRVTEPVQSTPPSRTQELTVQKPPEDTKSAERLQIKKIDEGVCPKCGSHNCEIQVQQNVTGSSKGYSAGIGCLGFLLTGPFGLLCGLCGRSSHTTTTHKSMWVCKECGNQFLPRTGMVSNLTILGAVNGFFLGLGASIALLLTIVAIVDRDTSEMKIPLFTVLITACLYYLIDKSMRSTIRQYGSTSPKEFFTPEEYASYKKSWCISFFFIPACIVIPAILIFIFI